MSKTIVSYTIFKIVATTKLCRAQLNNYYSSVIMLEKYTSKPQMTNGWQHNFLIEFMCVLVHILQQPIEKNACDLGS